MTGHLLDFNVSMSIQTAKEERWVTEVHAIENSRDDGTILRFDRDIFTVEFYFPKLYGKVERFIDGKAAKHEISGMTALFEILRTTNEVLLKSFENTPNAVKDLGTP